jgi:hypothetical protein
MDSLKEKNITEREYYTIIDSLIKINNINDKGNKLNSEVLIITKS